MSLGVPRVRAPSVFLCTHSPQDTVFIYYTATLEAGRDFDLPRHSHYSGVIPMVSFQHNSGGRDFEFLTFPDHTDTLSRLFSGVIPMVFQHSGGRDFDLPRHSHYSGVIPMVFNIEVWNPAIASVACSRDILGCPGVGVPPRRRAARAPGPARGRPGPGAAGPAGRGQRMGHGAAASGHGGRWTGADASVTRRTRGVRDQCGSGFRNS